MGQRAARSVPSQLRRCCRHGAAASSRRCRLADPFRLQFRRRTPAYEEAMNLATCSHPAATDLEMISAIAAGDERAFERLFQSHGGQMTAVARRFLRSEDDVNDAVQDALICVFKNAGGFRQDAKLSTWLHRIVVNACLMKLRLQR